jgi:hypothetical protein
MTERQYALGFYDGYKIGLEDATDYVTAKVWDDAFSAGYRAAKEEGEEEVREQ